jgi:hypothetical protein
MTNAGTGYDRRLSGIMAEALAHHIQGAVRVEECAVKLGPGGPIARCAAFQYNPPIVQLELELAGSIFGDVPVVDAWGSFGDSVEQAVVDGVHTWVSTPFQAIQHALLGGRPSGVHQIHNAAFGVHQDALMLRATFDAGELGKTLAARSPIRRVLDAGALPYLSSGRAHLVTCFGARSAGSDTMELKVDGWPWPAAQAVLEPLLRDAGANASDYVSFRQVSVLTPERPAGQPHVPPSLDSLVSSLRGLAAADAQREVFGARGHGYAFAPPIDAATLAAIEGRGIVLPPGYRELVTQAFSSGVGPGFGLLPPHTPPQLASLRGPFPHVSAWKPPQGQEAAGDRLVAGTLPLAHLGCGYFALLVVDGPAYGQVWADLRSAGEGLVPTHPSFVDWFFDWLDGALTRRLPAMPLKAGLCALPSALSSYLQSLEQQRGKVDARAAVGELPDGAIQTRSDGTDRYFDEGDAIDVCPLCEGLRRNLGMRPSILVPGVPPKAARALARPAG